MNRRWFLERIATLAGVGLATPVTAAAKPTRSAIELQRSPVAGFQYHDGEDVWPSLAVGASLRLVREPDNPYDPRAVRVDWRGTKLGYVPRSDNAAISHLLDGGQSLCAEITALCESDNPWARIEFAVTLA